MIIIKYQEEQSKEICFPYFADYRRHACFIDEAVPCLHCNIIQKCIPVTDDDDDEDEKGICPLCLSKGVLKQYGFYTNRFNDVRPEDIQDVSELKKIYPGLNDMELRNLYIAQCDQIAYATPKIYFWQHDGFPYMDGDFAEFLGYASKEDYIEHSKGTDPKLLYRSSHVRSFDDPLIEEMWEKLPDKKINSFKDTYSLHVTSYLFRSKKTGNYLTDCDMS